MRSVDVAIVGAGFAGCATAWALRQRGIRAVVLEREASLGVHASGRGAGLGRELAEDDDTSALTIRGAALLRERFAVHWRSTGGILAFDDSAACRAYVARARALDVPHEVLDGSVVARHWPDLRGVRIEAALLVPRDGVIDVRGVLHAYAEGLQIELGAAVKRIEPGRVVLEHETIEARCVVEASGAWAGAMTGDAPLDVFKRHLFKLEGIPELDTPYVWHLGAKELYLRADPTGVIASACDSEPTEPREQTPSLDADARLLSRLPSAHVKTRWACQRAFAADRKMRIGRDPVRPWLVWAAALGGHGATASAAVGERAAAAVQEVLDGR